MNEDIPDTALAQTLATLNGVRGVALPCIVIATLFSFLGTASGAIPDSITALVETVIMAVLGFSAYHYFLSEGREAPGIAAILAAPSFVLFLQLEIFVTLLMQVIAGLSTFESVPGIVKIALWLGVLYGLSRYGTVFPAVAVGGDPSLAAAEKRHTPWALAWRLLAAQALLLFMLSSLILLPGTVFEQGMGVGATTGLAVMTPLSVLLSAFGTVLIAVILAKAYQGRYR